MEGLLFYFIGCVVLFGLLCLNKDMGTGTRIGLSLWSWVGAILGISVVLSLIIMSGFEWLDEKF